jgi:hypothetical protein
VTDVSERGPVALALEDAVLPQVDDIVAAATDLLAT